MDWDKNGTISCIEFKSYLAKLKKGEELDHAECVEAFNAIDVDGSKQINWNEFFVSSICLIGSNTGSPFLQRKVSSSNSSLDFIVCVCCIVGWLLVYQFGKLSLSCS